MPGSNQSIELAFELFEISDKGGIEIDAEVPITADGCQTTKSTWRAIPAALK